MADKKHYTFSIDKDIKTEFHMLCVSNGFDMSTTVESLMSNFCKSMKQVKEDEQ